MTYVDFSSSSTATLSWKWLQSRMVHNVRMFILLCIFFFALLWWQVVDSLHPYTTTSQANKIQLPVYSTGMKGNLPKLESTFEHGILFDGNGSWEACGTCNTTTLPSIEGQSERTIVCKGEPGKMVLQETLSTYVHVSPQQCESICACPSCITCGVPARMMPTSITLNGKKHDVFTGNTRYLLLNVKLGGQEFVAKVGHDKKGHGEAKESHKMNTMQKIRDLCGFQDVVPGEYVGPLRAYLSTKKHGLQHILAENVQFSEYFQGVQVNRLHDLVTVIKGINQSQIVLSALHDFLVGIGDHFGGNILVSSDGNLKLIDNQAGSLGKFVSGIFLPGTRQFFKFRKHSKFFDYRCHIPFGMVGTQYPEQLDTCLKYIARVDTKTLANEFQMTNLESAYYLRERATWMRQGFEHALLSNLVQYTWKYHEYFQPGGDGAKMIPKNLTLPLKMCSQY